jgi:hypothetical protein
MKHPPIKQPDGSVMTESVSNSPQKAGVVKAGKTYEMFASWHFVNGFEYELVPGTWRREVYVDGKKVAEMTFEVYQP